MKGTAICGTSTTSHVISATHKTRHVIWITYEVCSRMSLALDVVVYIYARAHGISRHTAKG
jgi:hypothetical protein